MKHVSVTDQTTQGDVILERLGALKVPATMKTAIAGFKKSHAALTTASNAANPAKGARDTAMTALATADEALDAAVELLAAKMAGAGLGSRQNPFAGFSKLSPSAVTGMAYADEVKEVLALCAKVTKAKPAADVAKAASNCVKLAGNVTKALAGLTKPQLAYNKSLAARDALLLSWTKSLTVLKKTAAVAWIDDDATYKSVFAAPAKVQAPVKKRAKRMATKAAVAPVTETNGVPAGTLVKPATTTEPARS